MVMLNSVFVKLLELKLTGRTAVLFYHQLYPKIMEKSRKQKGLALITG